MTTQATTSAAAHPTTRPITPAGLFHLLVIYVVWSSTYLAIRIAVRPGAGFAPFTMGLMRAGAATLILLAWAALARYRLRLTRREWAVLAGSGLLLWVGGNGLVMVAEQRADSGLAALIIASIPIWTAIIEAVIDRKSPSLFLMGSLLVGFSGIVALTLPVLQSGVRADILSILALIFASVSWAFGSLLQTRNPVDLKPQVSAAVQMLAGSVGFAMMAALFNEPRPAPIPEAWLAWGYLVVIGSVFAFTSYVTVLRLLPTNIVMTYAYVNPVLAVLLGWLILDEKITGWLVLGSALVLVGVAGVFRERYRGKH